MNNYFRGNIGDKVKVLTVKGFPRGTVIRVYRSPDYCINYEINYFIRLYKDGSVLKDIAPQELESV